MRSSFAEVAIYAICFVEASISRIMESSLRSGQPHLILGAVHIHRMILYIRNNTIHLYQITQIAKLYRLFGIE